MLRTTAHHHTTMNAERFIRKTVGQGMADSLPLKTRANRGKTNVSRKIVTATAMVPITPG